MRVGFEPTSSDYEPDKLTYYSISSYCLFSEEKDSNLWSSVPKTDALARLCYLPIENYFKNNLNRIMMVGFEPTTLGLWFPRSTIKLHHHKNKSKWDLNPRVNKLTDSLANYCLKPDLAIRPKI